MDINQPSSDKMAPPPSLDAKIAKALDPVDSSASVQSTKQPAHLVDVSFNGKLQAL